MIIYERENQIVTDEDIIIKQNLIKDIPTYENEKLMEILESVNEEELKSISEIIDAVDRYAYYPNVNDGLYKPRPNDLLADNRISVRKNFELIARQFINSNVDVKFLTMLYLEVLNHRPISVEAIDKNEALNLYNELSMSVLVNVLVNITEKKLGL